MKNTKKTKIIIFTVIILAACMLAVLGFNWLNKYKKYEGMWYGVDGSILILNEDNECLYKDGTEDEMVEGTWELGENMIVVSECLDYDIYAKLDGAGEALLFKAHSDNWNDELFVRDK